jgi:cell division protein FtsW (lipid II flippase)
LLLGKSGAGVSYRNRELASLVVVALMTGFGFASVYIARQDVVSSSSLTYGILFLCLYLVAHVVTRITVPSADPYVLPLAGLLTAIGVTEIYRLGSRDALHQTIWIVVGLAAFALTLFLLRSDYRRLESYKYVCGIGALVLLVLPALPKLGQRVNGARLWIHVGSLQIQPGEFAKILMIVFLAGYLREKREVLAQGRLKDLGPLLLIWGAAMLVLLETSDLGSALLYFGIFLAMTYVATGRTLFVVGGLALFAAGAAAVYRWGPSRVHERVDAWLDPWGHVHTIAYQTVQGLYSIGNGHFGGTGFGKGTFTDTAGVTLIPDLKTDMIYSALAQELGLIGIAAFLLVYMVFALRGFRIGMTAEDGFSKLLVVGLTFGFVLQTFIIVGGVVRIIPLTGITLPFVSYGGSSIVANFVMLAGLLLVSDRAQRRLG